MRRSGWYTSSRVDGVLGPYREPTILGLSAEQVIECHELGDRARGALLNEHTYSAFGELDVILSRRISGLERTSLYG